MQPERLSSNRLQAGPLRSSRLSEQTNYRMQAVDSFEALQEFAAETQFPSHAPVGLPSQCKSGKPIHKAHRECLVSSRLSVCLWDHILQEMPLSLARTLRLGVFGQSKVAEIQIRRRIMPLQTEVTGLGA